MADPRKGWRAHAVYEPHLLRTSLYVVRHLPDGRLQALRPVEAEVEEVDEGVEFGPFLRIGRFNGEGILEAMAEGLGDVRPGDNALEARLDEIRQRLDVAEDYVQRVVDKAIESL